ncbi:hypothetical protein Y1Q_0012563 [Alligator mississippiensis]|uniref:Uncharacterized protein n=1 Tax=Alligator mississippiensis TaxID=8496 RepID=A0A151M844_ALLMI|nr:hypothetical protein Y1Q_0012563 [Alligator mississippiensis]
MAHFTSLGPWVPMAGRLKSLSTKGLSFCPTTQLNKVKLYGDLKAFFCHQRQKKYFHDKEPDNDQPTTGLNPTQEK